ncbi:unnamed protein product [Amoebophrya sp. A120]|nr:unnamed protein product [Amoebophrya sp. A120]|eukprot:GSA120T00018189001.1
MGNKKIMLSQPSKLLRLCAAAAAAQLTALHSKCGVIRSSITILVEAAAPLGPGRTSRESRRNRANDRNPSKYKQEQPETTRQNSGGNVSDPNRPRTSARSHQTSNASMIGTAAPIPRPEPLRGQPAAARAWFEVPAPSFGGSSSSSAPYNPTLTPVQQIQPPWPTMDYNSVQVVLQQQQLYARVLGQQQQAYAHHQMQMASNMRQPQHEMQMASNMRQPQQQQEQTARPPLGEWLHQGPLWPSTTSTVGPQASGGVDVASRPGEELERQKHQQAHDLLMAGATRKAIIQFRKQNSMPSASASDDRRSTTTTRGTSETSKQRSGSSKHKQHQQAPVTTGTASSPGSTPQASSYIRSNSASPNSDDVSMFGETTEDNSSRPSASSAPTSFTQKQKQKASETSTWVPAYEAWAGWEPKFLVSPQFFTGEIAMKIAPNDDNYEREKQQEKDHLGVQRALQKHAEDNVQGTARRHGVTGPRRELQQVTWQLDWEDDRNVRDRSTSAVINLLDRLLAHKRRITKSAEVTSLMLDLIPESLPTKFGTDHMMYDLDDLGYYGLYDFLHVKEQIHSKNYQQLCKKSGAQHEHEKNQPPHAKTYAFVNFINEDQPPHAKTYAFVNFINEDVARSFLLRAAKGELAAKTFRRVKIAAKQGFARQLQNWVNLDTEKDTGKLKTYEDDQGKVRTRTTGRQVAGSQILGISRTARIHNSHFVPLIFKRSPQSEPAMASQVSSRMPSSTDAGILNQGEHQGPALRMRTPYVSHAFRLTPDFPKNLLAVALDVEGPYLREHDVRKNRVPVPDGYSSRAWRSLGWIVEQWRRGWVYADERQRSLCAEYRLSPFAYLAWKRLRATRGMYHVPFLPLLPDVLPQPHGTTGEEDEQRQGRDAFSSSAVHFVSKGVRFTEETATALLTALVKPENLAKVRFPFPKQANRNLWQRIQAGEDGKSALSGVNCTPEDHEQQDANAARPRSRPLEQQPQPEFKPFEPSETYKKFLAQHGHHDAATGYAPVLDAMMKDTVFLESMNRTVGAEASWFREFCSQQGQEPAASSERTRKSGTTSRNSAGRSSGSGAAPRMPAASASSASAAAAPQSKKAPRNYATAASAHGACGPDAKEKNENTRHKSSGTGKDAATASSSRTAGVENKSRKPMLNRNLEHKNSAAVDRQQDGKQGRSQPSTEDVPTYVEGWDHVAAPFPSDGKVHNLPRRGSSDSMASTNTGGLASIVTTPVLGPAAPGSGRRDLDHATGNTSTSDSSSDTETASEQVDGQLEHIEIPQQHELYVDQRLNSQGRGEREQRTGTATSEVASGRGSERPTAADVLPCLGRQPLAQRSFTYPCGGASSAPAAEGQRGEGSPRMRTTSNDEELKQRDDKEPQHEHQEEHSGIMSPQAFVRNTFLTVGNPHAATPLAATSARRGAGNRSATVPPHGP